MRSGLTPPVVFVVAPGGIGEHGGIGRLVSATVREWRAQGLEPGLRILDPYGATLSPMTALYLLRAVAQLIWHARRGRIALVHIHMAARGSAVRKSVLVHVAARLGVPVLLHLHGSRLDDFHANLPPWARRWLRRTLDAAERIIVPGTYWRVVVVERVGVDPSRVRVLANAAAGPAQVVLPRPPRSRCELLFLGKLTAGKGLPELLEALAHQDVVPLSWRLRVGGDGDPGPLRARVAALGIAERVEFLGWVPEPGVHDLLRDSDVFVLPSHNEGLSIAMLEAMAHGCAVVATPVGAALDAVTDGESALMVPARDPQRLAAALRRVITEPALRATLQSAARRRWVEAFQIADHCRHLLALYHEICPALARAAPSVPEPTSSARSRMPKHESS